MIHVTKTVTVMRPRGEVFAFWREFENLPNFMHHLQSVDEIGGGRTHWVVRAPAGAEVEWDAEIVAEREHEFISWRSVEGSDIQNEGTVRFKDAPVDRGTEVSVDLLYDAPAGAAGAALAKLFGEEPAQQLTDDLRRFKQVMETGEVLRSDGSPEGAGQGATKQQPAQPVAAEAHA